MQGVEGVGGMGLALSWGGFCSQGLRHGIIVRKWGGKRDPGSGRETLPLQEGPREQHDAMCKTTDRAVLVPLCAQTRSDVRVGQAMRRTGGLAGFGLASHTDDPERGERHHQPMPLGTSQVLHFRVMPGK